ncbi:probable E3 SUMO-protein ligase RNF212 isoform X7 [Ovis aries]|uniref:probable E3 SUMO-protein ligase RNF212 isoform X7 n=1 Tax=Ovis aries TaxID=9940 RepID=UPI001C2EA19F|nr:probable E3 SUMO-protein ligase RNF212 isoform X7 [Ovis aries]XP_042107697.1 probable E3 SUMO-protein ligase RNF212 isoform X7 [Ovis aries]
MVSWPVSALKRCGPLGLEAVSAEAAFSLSDGLRHSGALHGHRRPVQEVRQGDLPDLRISRKAQKKTVGLLWRKDFSVGGVPQEVDTAGGAAAEGEVITTNSFQHSKNCSFKAESMEVDFTPSPRRKQTGTVSAPEPVWSVSGHFLFMRQPEVATGPPRISLLSPPRDGRMGSIAHRPQHLGLTPRCSSEPQAPRIPALQMPREWPRQSPAPAAGRGAAPRQPISVSGLMQRQRPGPAGLGGLARE